MEMHHRIRQLVSTFKSQLASVLDETELEQHHLTHTTKSSTSSSPCLEASVRGHHGTGGGASTGSNQVLRKLDQLSSLIDELSQDLELAEGECQQPRDSSTKTPEFDECFDGRHLVSLRGPPGSEPRNCIPATGHISETRYASNSSLVYQRNSIKDTLSSYYSPTKLSQIKLKDSPQESVEVFVTLPSEGQSQRCSRARERASLCEFSALTSINYSELSTDSDEEQCNSPSYVTGQTDCVRAITCNQSELDLPALTPVTNRSLPHHLSPSFEGSELNCVTQMHQDHNSSNSPDMEMKSGEVGSDSIIIVLKSHSSGEVQGKYVNQEKGDENFKDDSSTSSRGSGIFTVYNDLQSSLKPKAKAMSQSSKAAQSSHRLNRSRSGSLNAMPSNDVATASKVKDNLSHNLNPILRLTKLPLGSKSLAKTKESKGEMDNDDEETDLSSRGSPISDSVSGSHQNLSESLTWMEFVEELVNKNHKELFSSSNVKSECVSVDKMVEVDTPLLDTCDVNEHELTLTEPLLEDEAHTSEHGSESSKEVNSSSDEFVDSPKMNHDESAQSSVSPLKVSKNQQSTSTDSKLLSKRRLFDPPANSSSSSSENDFDMSIYQPPLLKGGPDTPTNKLSNAKKRKILSSISDNEDSEREMKETPLINSSERKVKVEKCEESGEDGAEDITDSAGQDIDISIETMAAKRPSLRLSKRKGKPMHYIPMQSVEDEVRTVSQESKDDVSQELKDDLPSISRRVGCVACGLSIEWKKTLAHRHERLDVIVCEQCQKIIRQGKFMLEDGHEIYCTLCGDGGKLVLCDFCDKSFCQACIARVSGNDHLEHLLNVEDANFTCYMCDPSPLEQQKRLLRNLQRKLLHTKNSKMKRLKKTFKSAKFVCDSDSNNDGELTLTGEPAKALENVSADQGSNSEDPTVTASADQGSNSEDPTVTASADQGSNSEDLIAVATREVCKENGSPSEDGTISDTKPVASTTKSRQSLGVFSDKSGVYTSSDDSLSGDHSPEVNTDDVSISDSSLLNSSRKRKKKSKGKEISERGKDKSEKNRSLHNHKETSLRIRVGPMALWGSDFECDSESSADVALPTNQRKAKRLLSVSSSESNGISRKTKRSRFAETLSSGSEVEGEDNHSKLTYEVFGNSDNQLLNQSLQADKSPLKAFTYQTFRTRVNLISSNSSDTEAVNVKRRSKRNRTRSVSITSSNCSSLDGHKRRTKQRAPLSDDDFTDLSRVGPRPKKILKQAIISDSDSESESGTETKSKKKVIKSESEDEDSDHNKSPDKHSTPGKKRRTIRKLISDAKLDEKTKLAQQREQERLNRLKQRIASTSEDQLMILEEDPKTKETKVMVRQSIVPDLKPHQKEGIKFLYDTCVESVDLFKTGQRNGAILAHCMGLGKTLQVIAFVDALLSAKELTVKRVLILTPINTIYNWTKEIEMWIPKCDFEVYMMNNVYNIGDRLRRLRRWFNRGGIMFIGYSLFRNLAMAKNIRKQATKNQLKEFLLDPGADIVVCDEGHVMRNSKSHLSVTLNKVKTLCRIVLTGTPLQNNLLEYYTMVNFVKPNLLGTLKEFTNRFANPIKNGQCSDSQPLDIRIMKQRAHILHSLVSGCVQRRDYRFLANTIPPKQEYVISFRLTPVQDALYSRFLDEAKEERGVRDLFGTFSFLAKVWNHPWVLKLSEIRDEEKASRLALDNLSDSDDSLKGFIVSGSDEGSIENQSYKRNHQKGLYSNTSSSRSSRQPSVDEATPENYPICIISSDSDSSFKLNEVKISIPPLLVKQEKRDNLVERVTAGLGRSETMSRLGNGLDTEEQSSKPWYNSLLTEEIENKLEVSGKFLFLMELLKEAEDRSEKVLVFSQSLLTLNLIENFLNKPEYGEWTPGLDYHRLDGSTKAEMRQCHITEFNNRANDRIRLFLSSTKAGSLGVNLVAANRVVIFDACWNPSHDLQAIFRTYRYGQTKPIFVYRLLAQGTMEEKIYDRQIMKESLSMRVVDEKQIGRHYTESDLAELFTYTPKLPTSPPYKRPEGDPVLCSILDKMEPEHIYGYHEHDSLLEHVYGEELSEEERKAAWESYKQQMSAETRRYNIDALQSKLDEEGKALGLSTVAAHLQTPLNLANPQGPSEGHKQLHVVQETLAALEYAINAYKKLVGHYFLMLSVFSQISVGQTPVRDGRQEVDHLSREKPQLESKARELLKVANEAILSFNKAPSAQIPKLNQMVSQKRINLEQIYMRAQSECQKLNSIWESFFKSPNISRYHVSEAYSAMSTPTLVPSRVIAQHPSIHSLSTAVSRQPPAQFITAEASSTTDIL